MRDVLVALDVETTGLDANHDAIIEIGAVRIQDGRILDEYSTLVNPGIAVPPYVTHLTGIQSEDLVGAPRIGAVLPHIRDFAGNAPIIAHNVGFDVGFFAPHGILQTNTRIDTYELAAALLPRAVRYNLNSLTQEMGITLENAHRALDDARACALLYWALWEKALTLPRATLREIATAGEGIAWDARVVFAAALRELENGPLGQDKSATHESLFAPLVNRAQPLQQNDTTVPLNAAEVEAIFAEDGPLAKALPGYEVRNQQVDMARAVTDSFNTHQHVMVESGTGTGKSIAYLIPAILLATANNERVVISTHTLNLQEQLIDKDIPALRDALGVPFVAAVLKGRGNYLCPRRLMALRRRGPTSAEELRMLAKILVWLLDCDSGEKSDISVRGAAEHMVWQQLSAQDEDCTVDRCEAMMAGACPFFKARVASEAAHLVVVNHALLVSDALADHHVLPEYRYVILDEAHHLEDAVTQGLSFQIDEAGLMRSLYGLGNVQRGLLGDILQYAEKTLPERDYKKLRAFVEQLSQAIRPMTVHVSALFKTALQFVIEMTASQQSDYLVNVLIQRQQRDKPTFAYLQATWGTLAEFFAVISEAMQQLADGLKGLKSLDATAKLDFQNSIQAVMRSLNETSRQLRGFLLEPDSNIIYWMSSGATRASMTFHTAPLHIGKLVDQYIWEHNHAVVMTSATLRSHDSFDFVADRLLAENVKTLELGSPFDYARSTLVYVPDDIPEPNIRQEYQQAVERGLIELATALDGRVMGLFTSYTQLRQTAQAISPRLALGNITVYDQSDGTGREALLEGFKSSEKAVLLGTKSFWEGVDIPGESLSALVIVRLPFAVPSDPIFAARSDKYSDSFNNYALPDAILRFRQGFGRLIRSQTDRGVVAIFDSRVLTRSYGSAFIEALPECTVQRGALEMLASTARSWLDNP